MEQTTHSDRENLNPSPLPRDEELESLLEMERTVRAQLAVVEHAIAERHPAFGKQG